MEATGPLVLVGEATGVCESAETELLDLLSTAAYLQVAPLVKATAAIFKGRLTAETCLDV